jgi:DNA-binding transcriptional ArsR family regulator
MMIPRLEDIGRMVGDRSRAAMLSALMDGRARTGRELAACAHVTAPTASAHLQRLVHGRLISVFAQGRHRYYRIASHQVASAFVGSTASLMTDGIALLQRLGIAIASEPSRKVVCRPCIDWSERRPHVAGMVGGALANLALDRNWIARKADSRAVTVTAAGIDAFRTLFQFECDLSRGARI